MAPSTFERSSVVAMSAGALFTYHARPGALRRLTPPFVKIRNIEEAELLPGAVATCELGVGPFWSRFVADIVEVRDAGPLGGGFVDVMKDGPLRSWTHEHIFDRVDDTHARLTDRVTFEPPAGGSIGAAVVDHRLARMFTHRHATTMLDAALLRSFGAFGAAKTEPLVVGVTGASGLIGQELAGLFGVAGHTVVPITRHAHRRAGEGHFDVDTGLLELPNNVELDAVVHLAGEPIANGRLTAAHARRVRDSRVRATTRLIGALQQRSKPPRVFVGAGAVGYFGDRGDEILDDAAKPGTGLLAAMCSAWEEASLSASSSAAASSSMRVVVLRLGIVLSPASGALAQLLPAFRAGAGAKLGDGKQWMPLITIDDTGALFLRALADESMSGVYNATLPEPLRNADFTDVVARVLHRPALLTIPRVAARAMFGTAVADEAYLASDRVVPSRLMAGPTPHAFRHTNIEAGLRHVLGLPP